LALRVEQVALLRITYNWTGREGWSIEDVGPSLVGAHDATSTAMPIVCGTDFSGRSRAAAATAASFAASIKDVELWLVHGSIASVTLHHSRASVAVVPIPHDQPLEPDEVPSIR
jgi:hypothetical protein